MDNLSDEAEVELTKEVIHVIGFDTAEEVEKAFSTAALDPMAEYEVYKNFHQIVGGKTAIYISHRLSSCRFCDKIAVFSNGTITEYGTHDELCKLSGGLYGSMWAAQAKYYQ